MDDQHVPRGGGASQLLDDSASFIIDSADNSMCSQTSEDSAVFQPAPAQQQQQHQHQHHSRRGSKVDADCSGAALLAATTSDAIPRSSNLLNSASALPPQPPSQSANNRRSNDTGGGSASNFAAFRSSGLGGAPSASFSFDTQHQQHPQQSSLQRHHHSGGGVPAPSHIAPIAAAPVVAAPANVAAGAGEKFRSVSEEDFERVGVLGSGAYGTVYDAVHRPSGTRVALKEIPRWRIRGKAAEEAIKSEINVHRRLRHRNVVRLYSYYVTKSVVVLVLERCSGGTLLGLLHKQQQQQQSGGGGGLPEQTVARAIRHVASALHYLHQQHGVIHRDVKGENILLDEHGVAKLTDFGLSRVFHAHDAGDGQQQQQLQTRSTFCGTLDYMAPEVVRGDLAAMAAAAASASAGREGGHSSNNKPTSPQEHLMTMAARADVWSLGVLAVELLTGQPPFYDESEAATLQRIQHANPSGLFFSPPHSDSNSNSGNPHQQGNGRLSSLNVNRASANGDGNASPATKARRQQGHQQQQQRFSAECTALLLRMLTKDPLQRPPIAEVLAAPWLLAAAHHVHHHHHHQQQHVGRLH